MTGCKVLKSTANVVPSPSVNVKFGLIKDAVVNNEPVSVLPPPPLVIVTVTLPPATDALTPDPTKSMEATAGVNCTPSSLMAMAAATLVKPDPSPTKYWAYALPDTRSDPVICSDEVNVAPDIITRSFVADSPIYKILP